MHCSIPKPALIIKFALVQRLPCQDGLRQERDHLLFLLLDDQLQVLEARVVIEFGEFVCAVRLLSESRLLFVVDEASTPYALRPAPRDAIIDWIAAIGEMLVEDDGLIGPAAKAGFVTPACGDTGGIAFSAVGEEPAPF